MVTTEMLARWGKAGEILCHVVRCSCSSQVQSSFSGRVHCGFTRRWQANSTAGRPWLRASIQLSERDSLLTCHSMQSTTLPLTFLTSSRVPDALDNTSTSLLTALLSGSYKCPSDLGVWSESISFCGTAGIQFVEFVSQYTQRQLCPVVSAVCHHLCARYAWAIAIFFHLRLSSNFSSLVWTLIVLLWTLSVYIMLFSIHQLSD